MGHANVKHWVDDILPLLLNSEPLGVDDFATHRLSLEQAPGAYETFQKQHYGMVESSCTRDHRLRRVIVAFHACGRRADRSDGRAGSRCW